MSDFAVTLSKIPHRWWLLTWTYQTVPESSACIDSAERVGLPVRHCMLQKHRSPDGIGFVRISQRLKEFADKSDEVLKRRGKLSLASGYTAVS